MSGRKNGSFGVVSAPSVAYLRTRRGLAPTLSPEAPLTPNWQDLPKLGRRYLRRILAAAREEDLPTPGKLLTEFLGTQAAAMPLLSESWPSYDHINVQAGLDAWLAGGGRSSELHGIAGFQHHDFTLADLIGGTCSARLVRDSAAWP